MFLVRPPAVRWVRRLDADRPAARGRACPALLAAVLLCALATEAIGIHAMFGAFLLGAVLPHDSRLAREVAAPGSRTW